MTLAIYLPHSPLLDVLVEVRGGVRVRHAILDLILDVVGVETGLSLVQVMQVMNRCRGSGSHVELGS